jgi:peptide-methionine (R)-S-oxide reductase
MIDRRCLLAGGAVAAIAGLRWATGSRASAADAFEIQKSESEWRQLLTSEQFEVLRNHGTERPYSSPLNAEKRAGTFACAGCDLPLFSSKTKFESGTGWPSFYAPLPDAIGTKQDYSYLMKRTEVHCRRCGGHLGHVFDDGPKPTGLRYCMNGLALKFIPGPAPGPA